MPEAILSVRFARDGIVSIINEANPFNKEIMESGFGTKLLDRLQAGTGSGSYESVKVFICSDTGSTCKVVSDLLGIDPDHYRIITTESVQHMIDSVRNDPLSLGLCCHRYAFDPLTREEIPHIKVIPIDCNGNGILDDQENFYGNLDELRRAMWSGKYPCHTFLNYYIVTTEEPLQKSQIYFTKWVLTSGQKQLQHEGYIMLRSRELKEEIEKVEGLLASL
jgi:hypothetical protein